MPAINQDNIHRQTGSAVPACGGHQSKRAGLVIIVCGQCGKSFVGRPYLEKKKICNICLSKRRARYYRNNKIHKSSNEKRVQYRRNAKKTPKGRQRHTAQNIAKKAVQRGKIKKMPCEICGDENVVIHHKDYSKPLEIIFLCRQCHINEHRKLIAERIYI